MSTKAVQQSVPSSMLHSLKSRHLLSLMPLSTPLASSIDSLSGGPASNVGEAIGRSSTPTFNVPASGLSGNGVEVIIFTPTITSVSPIFTLAEPSASSEMFFTMFIFLYWSKALASSLFPSLIACNTLSVLKSQLTRLLIVQRLRFLLPLLAARTFSAMPVFEARKPALLPRKLFLWLQAILFLKAGRPSAKALSPRCSGVLPLEYQQRQARLPQTCSCLQ